MKNRFIALSFSLFYALFANIVFAEDRVGEVEGLIREDVKNYIRLIRPGLNFSVYVKVKPRLNTESRVQSGDSLPFFSNESEEVEIEPWRDPNTPIFKLYARIQKADIEINFSSSVQIANIKDFQLNVIRSVGLIPGRDDVKINFVNQPVIKKNFSTILFSERNIAVTIIACVILFLGTIFFVTLNRYLSIRTATTRAKQNASDKPESNETPGVAPMVSGGMSNISSGGVSSKLGKLSFSDPTRSTELLRDKLKQIINSQTFPNLNDMLILMEMLEHNIRSFAFLVYELPKEIQDKVYEQGKTDLWYKGFTEVGELDPDIFHSIDKMLRSRNFKSNELFESLLIQCWRMDKTLEGFIKRIDKKEAFSILYYLPKNIAISVARSVYPGSWGDLLSEEKIPAISNAERLKDLLKISNEFAPPYTKKSLETYTSRQDLVTYLKECRPNEEEDIYKVLGDNSELEKIRPPFFAFFKLNKDDKRSVFELMPLDRWAIALFDAPREYRQIFEEILSEKEVYLLSVYLTRLNSSDLDHFTINEVRENIGKLTQTHIYNKALISLDNKGSESENDNDDENSQKGVA